jgi:hypothetical protein
MPRRVVLPCADLVLRYTAGQSTTILARHYHCSPTTIAKLLRECGAAVRTSRFQPIHLDESTLRQLYLDERLPIATIAARLGVSVTTIGNKRRRAGIPTRPRRPPPTGD